MSHFEEVLKKHLPGSVEIKLIECLTLSEAEKEFEEWHDNLCCVDCATRCLHKEWEKNAYLQALRVRGLVKEER